MRPAVVVKIGGAVCAEPHTIAAFAAAWAARPEGSPDLVLVHGGGPQLDLALSELGEPVLKVQGLRVTSHAAAGVVRRTLDAVGAELASTLEAHGVPTQHVPATARLFSAVPKPHDGPSLGRVGTVTRVDGDRLQDLAAPGRVAVVTPVGWDSEGPLNINADEGASALATSLLAKRLVLATDVPYVRDVDGEPVNDLSPADVARLLSGAAHGGMVPKLQAATRALDAGVEEVCIGRLESAWRGIGTRIRRVAAEATA